MIDSLSYEQYVACGGELTSAEFERVVGEAVAWFNMETRGRAADSDAVRRALSGLCDCIHSERANGITSLDRAVIASESVGNHSISYKASVISQAMRARRDVLCLYLWNTGLLYRGLKS